MKPRLDTWSIFEHFHINNSKSPKLQINSNILGFENWLVSATVLTGRQLSLCHLTSASKSRTINLVSSVPFLDPTAQTWLEKKIHKVVKGNMQSITSLVGEDLILQTTPPDPPDSRATKSLMNSPATMHSWNIYTYFDSRQVEIQPENFINTRSEGDK